jgi:outer membrane protein assembly factor BamD
MNSSLKTMTLIVLTGMMMFCGGKKEPTLDPAERGSDKKMYDNAIKYISRDAEKARLLFKEVIQMFPDSIFATRSKLGIADSYFKEKDSASMTLAVSEYQEYVNMYPYSPDAVYAKSQVGMCYFKQVRKPGRDQTPAFSAIKAYQSLIEQYPGTPEAEDGKKKIEFIRQNLAIHFYRIGYYNYKLKAFRGAIERFKQVMEEYPDFNSNDQVYYYIAKCYTVTRENESAISFYQKIVNEYPKSQYASKAISALKKLTKLTPRKKEEPAAAEKIK